MKPLAPALRAEIDSLAADLDKLLSKRPKTDPRDFPEALQTRRRALLAKHLGHEVPAELPLLHVIGDSNSMFFAGAEHLRFIRYGRIGFWRPRYINRGLDLLPCFRVFHTGPSTAWNAAEFGSSTRNREKIEWLLRKKIPVGAKVMLSFGEIDCRIHMPKQILKGKDLQSVVEATADRLIPLIERVAGLGFDCSHWGVPQVIPREENDPQASLPAVGPVELRQQLTYAYTLAMQERCAAKGIRYVALSRTLGPPGVLMPHEAFHDGVHLSQAMMPQALAALEEAGILDQR